MSKPITIFGSTGSIGTQTLEVVANYSDRFSIFGLSAGRNIKLLKTQIQKFNPRVVVVQGENDARQLAQWTRLQGFKITVLYGESGLVQLARSTDHQLIVAAIVGTTALRPVYEAIKAGITIGLACKEVLVAAGSIMMSLAKEKNVSILPIDSEHAAIKQCLAGINEDVNQISRLILSASGGPFFRTPIDAFTQITREQALKHPSWKMGSKITIDSATLMNKGLEVIEAHHLFDVPFSQLSVIIHPKSIIHSLVEFTDGTMLAQMGLPDMRFPIQYVLTYPEKWENPWPKTHLWEVSPIEFFEPDFNKFRLLKLAFEVGEKGESYPVVFNAANEAAVAAFLDDRIPFYQIPEWVEEQLNQFSHCRIHSIEDVISIDRTVKTLMYA